MWRTTSPRFHVHLHCLLREFTCATNCTGLAFIRVCIISCLPVVWNIAACLQDECQKYGTVMKLTIPRPTTEQPHPVGLGLIMIEYSDMAAALKAKQAMHGRKFGGHTVEGTFLSETDYQTGNFHSTAS